MNSKDIECAIAQWLGERQHLIVPNVSWGLGLHECDLLALSKSGYATEIEIKISKSDLIRDQKKKHDHRSGKIKYLYFAMPLDLQPHIMYVPANAGIIFVSYHRFDFQCAIARRPQCNAAARPFTIAEQFQLARLGTLRMWALKHDLRQVHLHTESDYQI